MSHPVPPSPGLRIALPALAIGALAALAACGGGGSSDLGPDAGGGGASPAAGLAVLANAYDAPSDALEAAETSLQVAQLLQRAIGNIGIVPRPGVERRCGSGPGRALYAWTDADGDGVWSAGDAVSARFEACDLPTIGAAVDGELRATITTPPDVGMTRWAAMASMASPLSIGTQGRQVQGTIGVGFEGSPFQEVLSLRSDDAAELTIRTRLGHTGVVRSASSSVTLDYDRSESTVHFAFDLLSDFLGGTVHVTTPTAFRTGIVGAPYKRPFIGTMRISGADSDHVELILKADGFTQQLVRAATGPQGTPQYQLFGVAGITHSLWWIGKNFDDASTSGILNLTWHSCYGRCSDVAYPSRGEVTGAAPIRLYFNAPVLQSDTDIQLIDVGPAPSSPVLEPTVAVPVDIYARGNAIVVVPRAPLDLGRQYRLVNARGGIDYEDGQSAFGVGDLEWFSTRLP